MNQVSLKDTDTLPPGDYFIYGQVKDVSIGKTGKFLTLFDGTASQSFMVSRQSSFSSTRLNKGDMLGIGFKISQEKKRGDSPLVTQIKMIMGAEKEDILSDIAKRSEDFYKPIDIPFLMEHPALIKMKPALLEAAGIILKAIHQSRKIIIRFHGDCDGFCAAIALENAIVPLIDKQGGNSRQRPFRKMPSKSPFYDYFDASRDVSQAYEDKARFNNPLPLMLIVDNGSGEEDIASLQKLKIAGVSSIVIDHHHPFNPKDKEQATEKFTDLHINPYLQGGDSNLTAGIICSELSRLINKDTINAELTAALSSITDKADDSTRAPYFRLCKDKGLDEKFLDKMARVVDYEAFYQKNFEGRGFIEELLNSDRERQTLLVDSIYPRIMKMNNDQIMIFRSKAEKKIIGKNALVTIDLDSVMKRNSYPSSGKSVGLLFDSLKDEHPNLVVLGTASDFITVRAQHPSFSLSDIINKLQEEFPEAGVEGGGHEVAGTIKFLSIEGKEIIESVKKKVEGILYA